MRSLLRRARHVLRCRERYHGFVELSCARSIHCTSSNRLSHEDVETKSVRVAANNGEITLDIYHVPRHQSATDSVPNAILYLPRGPFFPSAEQRKSDNDRFVPDALIARHIALASKTYVVKLNYRLQPPFPTAIHDTLMGLDWMVANLSTTFTSRYGRKGTPFMKLGVAGELLGGSLALMLALTECRVGESRIVAAAASAPVVDWVLTPPVSALESAGSGKSRRKRGPTDASGDASGTLFTTDSAQPLLTREDLLHTRRAIFPEAANPSSYFDRFASPIYFLRTAGVGVPPPTYSAADAQEPFTLPDADEDVEEDDSLHPSQDETETDPDLEPSQTISPLKKRKSPLRYPPSGTALRVPDFRLSVPSSLKGSMSALSPLAPFTQGDNEDAATLLTSQATDFAQRLRRSLARYGDASPGCPAIVARSYSAAARGRGLAFDEGAAGDDMAEREHAVGEALRWAEGKVRLEDAKGAYWGAGDDGSRAWEEEVTSMGSWLGERLRSAKS